MSAWKIKRDRLAILIKKCSDMFGGDDQKWLKEYGLELINDWKDNLDVPISACEDILKPHIKRYL
jgi:hypothetical protein